MVGERRAWWGQEGCKLDGARGVCLMGAGILDGGSVTLLCRLIRQFISTVFDLISGLCYLFLKY